MKNRSNVEVEPAGAAPTAQLVTPSVVSPAAVLDLESEHEISAARSEREHR
jgi:hypothetical protein